jgi:hypothetical protein
MTAWLLALGAALLLLGAAVLVRRRGVERDRRRAQALGRLAERLERSLGDVRAPTFPPLEPAAPQTEGRMPLVDDRLPGRAALLDAVAAEVERARAGSTRLTIVLVRVAGSEDGDSLVDAVREVTGRGAYLVGPGVVAFTLPGLGRADGLGTVARIESQSPSAGHAVEWMPGETAAELVARLLEPGPAREPR